MIDKRITNNRIKGKIRTLAIKHSDKCQPMEIKSQLLDYLWIKIMSTSGHHLLQYLYRKNLSYHLFR